MKPCAIVILNFNGASVLSTFLPSVVQESTYDIYIIDNGSQDDSIQFLEEKFPEVKLIKLDQNFGFAGGYNEGLSQLEGKYWHYILLNSDVEVSPNWDVALVSWLDENSDFATVQPKILSFQNKNQYDYAGAGGGFVDRLGYPYCRGRIWNRIENDQGNYDDTIEVDWSSGACFAIRSEIFHAVGGFDHSFFAHMEEVDLCYRLRQEGWKIGYKGDVAVYHLGGATLDRASPRKLYLNIRNSLSMLYKNENDRFWSRFILKGILETLASMGYVLSGKAGLAKAIWKGYSDFLIERKKLQVTERHKKKVQSAGPSNLIFWDFFMLGRKTFDQL